MPPARGAAKYQEGEPVLCFQGGLIYEAKVQALQKEDGVIQYCIHYKGWNKTWDECVPEQRLLKMTPTNLQKQKDLQLASKQKLNEAEAAKSKKESDAKLKKSEGDSTTKVKKADVKTKRTAVDGQKLSNTELGASKQQRSGTPPVGGKRSSSLGGNKKGSSSSRGSKRSIEEGECAIKELRLNVPRLKKLKSRSTSESSSASEDLSAKSNRRPQRAAALAPKIKIGEARVNKKPQKFIFEYWAFSQKSYLNGGCFEEIHICIPKILYLHTS